MYLKQLDIQGFKSFPEKVKLEFNTGITAVVGPNGSGKSNVSDAVRWVLGEQRAKSLRGDKMEDIIFSGTQSRKALGFAEVAITIDNQDHKMPIDYTEVTVSRRVFRSGESEYQINGTGCRLKDIHELFMDTGVGREGYSLIGQGRIDEILSQKGDDRRRLFEEAAGIVKYKTRKVEAWQKMERERQNLERVEDIITELSVQLAPLHLQSEKARNYLDLREMLKSAELSLFCMEVDKLEEETLGLEEKQGILQEAVEQVVLSGQTHKEKNISLLENIDRLTMEIQTVNDEIVAVRTELEKKDGEIRLTEEQIQNYKNNRNRIEQDNAKRQQLILENAEEIQLLESQTAAADLGIHVEQERLALLSKNLEELNAELSENESLSESYQTDIVEQIKISTQAKGDIGKREVMAVQFEKRKEQLEGEKNYLQSQMHDNETHLQALEKQILVLKENEANLKIDMEKSEAKSRAVKQGIVDLSAEISKQERSLGEKKSRFKILSDMEKEHEGYFKSVKSILQLKGSQNPLWQGICGAVGELIQVEERYETAMEAALGGAVQNIVTKTEEDAKAAINHLKQYHLGRATFLPISAVKGKSLGRDADLLLKEAGVLGVADQLIEYDAAYSGVIASLLGRTVVVDTLDNGVIIAKKYRHQYKLVTLEGDILNPGGAMTGGSAAKKASGIFGRSREIKELKSQIEEENAVLAEISQGLAKARQDLTSLEQEMLEQKMTEQKWALSKISMEDDVKKTILANDEQKEKLSLYQLEESQLEKQQAYIREDLEVFEKKLAEANAIMEDLNSRLSGFLENVESEKAKREGLLGDITELKISLSSKEQQKLGHEEAKRRIARDDMQQNVAINEARQEQERLLIAIKGKQEEIEAIQKAAEVESCKEQQSQQKLTAIVDSRKTMQMEATEHMGMVQRLSEDLAKLQNDLFRIESKIEKSREDKQRFYDQMWEDYQCTYQMAKEAEKQDKAYSVLKQEVQKSRESMKALGNVNVGAIEQFKEVNERYLFLTAQKEDILSAEEKLQAIIEELSLRMEERFKEQLELISQNFNEVFQEMFGGGKAYLKLTDENAVLDSPIEIIAQPPGKSLQNMLLLSGGERALTAIAILFSILKMKPSPFCILDEIEAALDDANVKRFARYLTKFAKDTQFIVITHRKGTMEAADIMYGVTMQEKGVSKLISVNFSDREFV